MSGIPLVILMYVAVLGTVYFSLLFLGRWVANRKVSTLTDTVFLQAANFNLDYLSLRQMHSLDPLMLDWHFAYNARNSLLGHQDACLDRAMLKIPQRFLGRMFLSLETGEFLPPVAAAAAVSSLLNDGLGREFARYRLPSDSWLPIDIRAADQTVWKRVCVVYFTRSAQRATGKLPPERALNLSELYSLGRLFSAVGMNAWELLGCEADSDVFLSYVNRCRRFRDGKFIGYAINSTEKYPCICGTLFGVEVAQYFQTRSKAREHREGSDATIHGNFRPFDPAAFDGDLQYLLDITYNDKLGGFSAYRRGIPTLVHTELALKLSADINYDMPADRKTRIVEFIVRCRANGGFSLYPSRKADAHATKCALRAFEFVRPDPCEGPADLLRLAGMEETRCIQYLENVLSSQGHTD